MLTMSAASSPIEIIDVRNKAAATPIDGGLDLRAQIVQGLSLPPGQKTLPTLLLYDERGLRIYDDITTQAPEYYLFGAEEDILKKHADDVVRYMHAQVGEHVTDEAVVELGAG